MRKITFCIAIALATISVHAQQTSFESSEGYTAEEFIDGINGWQETSETSNYFSISNENASEGENSLKMIYDPNQPLIFADWNFQQALPLEDNLEISMDIYAPGGSTTFYWKIMSNDAYAAYIIVQEEYVFPAIVNAVNPVPIAMADINVEEFNEIKLRFDYTEETITYYANGVQIHQGDLWGSMEPIDQYAFEVFLFEDMYMDNLQTNTLLSTEDFSEITFTHYLQNNTLNLQSAVKMESIEVYNILGQQVHSEDLENTQESINLSSLISGVYIVRLEIDKKWFSFKFMK